MEITWEGRFLMKKLSEYLFLWTLGGTLYYTFEMIFPGFSHLLFNSFYLHRLIQSLLNEEISMGYDPEGGYRSGFSFGWRFGR